MKTAIITGIAGQDGSYLSKLLIDKGYKVVGIDKDTDASTFKNMKYLGIYDKVLILGVDLQDFSSVRDLIEQTNPDEIYNLAALSSVGLSFSHPKQTIEFNIVSTINMLEAIRVLNIKTKFYQASSSEMFGNVNEKNLPLKEASIFHPVSPYAVSKTAAHWATVNYRESYNIFTTCGILFNHESVFRNKNFVTKKILNTAVKISLGIEKELVLGDTQIYRDWGYAPEYVKAMWLMMQQEKPDDFIVCSGRAYSLEEFVKEAFNKLKLDYRKHLKINQDLYRPSELRIIWGDNSKAKKVLGWNYDLSFKELIGKLTKEEIAYVERELAENKQ